MKNSIFDNAPRYHLGLQTSSFTSYAFSPVDSTSIHSWDRRLDLLGLVVDQRSEFCTSKGHTWQRVRICSDTTGPADIFTGTFGTPHFYRRTAHSSLPELCEPVCCSRVADTVLKYCFLQVELEMLLQVRSLVTV